MLSTPKYTRTRRETEMADSREVMNIRQASQYLGVSPDTLYKYVNEQKIPAFKLGNRGRFKKSRLDQVEEGKSPRSEAHHLKQATEDRPAATSTGPHMFGFRPKSIAE